MAGLVADWEGGAAAVSEDPRGEAVPDVGGEEEEGSGPRSESEENIREDGSVPKGGRNEVVGAAKRARINKMLAVCIGCICDFAFVFLLGLLLCFLLYML